MIKIYTTIVDEPKWDNFNIEAIVNAAVRLISENLNILEDEEISIVFTNDNKVQELNKIYRKKDAKTNVLSFAFNDDGSNDAMLGEIFLSYGVIVNEAKAQSKKLEEHLTHMLIHGFLHLLGYDHVEDKEAEEMETLEVELLKKINIENPYKKC